MTLLREWVKVPFFLAMPAFFLARDDVNVLLQCHDLAPINGNGQAQTLLQCEHLRDVLEVKGHALTKSL